MTVEETDQLAADLRSIARARGIGHALLKAAIDLYLGGVVQELEERGWKLARAPKGG